MCHAAAGNAWLYGLTVSTLSALMHAQRKNSNNGSAPVQKLDRHRSDPVLDRPRSRTSNRTGAISTKDINIHITLSKKVKHYHLKMLKVSQFVIAVCLAILKKYGNKSNTAILRTMDEGLMVQVIN